MLKLYYSTLNTIRQFPFLKKYPAVKELLRYSLVGNLSNMLDLGLYIYLTRAFFFWQEHYLTVNIFTMLIASIARFVFHKHWTFRDNSKNIHRQYVKFILVMILGLIISELVLFITVEYIGCHDIIGKIIGMIICTLIVYYLTKKWVFNKEELNNKINN
ncbi:hypothetical protein CO134_00505 [Candidatus Kuenenbacteria bacterium CG_4_9_14_3_um_filter_39_14]|uniref:GtrA/DPMS transmembrane domain-containing protein n=6 Tax=Candidatus Kueneniibacteriota TaxID=1752740 RepID=A0A2M7IM25_9BACT|nr:GtrA family protein [Candidatus Kuenenbacteria bacterium]OIP56490.1 MAG: hypothetical protein AUK13_00960 [Candidatus Kuenenbacteria bacterium CG2_30_39_24]PIP29105.1 MAG: hypothetical protein COX28_00975 [Candidatus Kuenenbacteria bacterium CG23_combo_of_CG06-09_8_20_14_all_39_39]PIP75722.1 MAG: hypothetical protein COW86_02155 [Candidatus Kuenenbacteria bacterium CG22_combo_CG10-13_8_21_14_all_39_9]PIR80671.1 MAG: hypothetical protein COU24_02740 [Candidatus Kuenenbacteria bacterium CG10_b